MDMGVSRSLSGGNGSDRHTKERNSVSAGSAVDGRDGSVADF